MGRGRSGRVGFSPLKNTKQNTASTVNENDYNAGGKGLLGSILFITRKQADKFFRVFYNNDEYKKNNFDKTFSGPFMDWYNSASPEERAAAEKYTSSAYVTINEYLRDQKLDSAPSWVKSVVKGIDRAMKKFDLPQAITVWRGGSNKLVGGATTVSELNAMKGSVVIDRGITSTAVTEEKAWGMSGSKIGYEIVYPKGKGRGIYVDPISSHHGEQEFMAARDTRYEVLGGYKDKYGHVICRLKAIY